MLTDTQKITLDAIRERVASAYGANGILHDCDRLGSADDPADVAAMARRLRTNARILALYAEQLYEQVAAGE